MNILFLCTSNLHRSKTAQELFQTIDKNNHYRSAGLSEKYVNKAGSTLCSIEVLNWSDAIYVFEEKHIHRIEKYTGTKHVDKLINLDIEDKYQYFQRELVLTLLEKIQLPVA